MVTMATRVPLQPLVSVGNELADSSKTQDKIAPIQAPATPGGGLQLPTSAISPKARPSPLDDVSPSTITPTRRSQIDDEDGHHHPVKYGFIHYDSPVGRISLQTPPRTVPSGFGNRQSLLERLRSPKIPDRTPVCTPIMEYGQNATPSTAGGAHFAIGGATVGFGPEMSVIEDDSQLDFEAQVRDWNSFSDRLSAVPFLPQSMKFADMDKPKLDLDLAITTSTTAAASAASGSAPSISIAASVGAPSMGVPGCASSCNAHPCATVPTSALSLMATATLPMSAPGAASSVAAASSSSFGGVAQSAAGAGTSAADAAAAGTVLRLSDYLGSSAAGSACTPSACAASTSMGYNAAMPPSNLQAAQTQAAFWPGFEGSMAPQMPPLPDGMGQAMGCGGFEAVVTAAAAAAAAMHFQDPSAAAAAAAAAAALATSNALGANRMGFDPNSMGTMAGMAGMNSMLSYYGADPSAMMGYDAAGYPLPGQMDPQQAHFFAQQHQQQQQFHQHYQQQFQQQLQQQFQHQVQQQQPQPGQSPQPQQQQQQQQATSSHQQTPQQPASKQHRIAISIEHFPEPGADALRGTSNAPAATLEIYATPKKDPRLTTSTASPVDRLTCSSASSSMIETVSSTGNRALRRDLYGRRVGSLSPRSEGENEEDDSDSRLALQGKHGKRPFAGKARRRRGGQAHRRPGGDAGAAVSTRI
mmetsp:Transcript_39646/g.84716  ORF Transcript_39646/g.84716 Transcript_39646/m.84716 type:complete len:698 (-) Transcript_39646:477-2570(-)